MVAVIFLHCLLRLIVNFFFGGSVRMKLPRIKIVYHCLRGRIKVRIDKVQQALAIVQVDVGAAEYVVHRDTPGLHSKLFIELVAFQDVLKREIADAVTLIKPLHIFLIFLPILLRSFFQSKKFFPKPFLTSHLVFLNKLIHPEALFFTVHLDVQRLALRVESDGIDEILKLNKLVPPAAAPVLLLLAWHIFRIVFSHSVRPPFLRIQIAAEIYDLHRCKEHSTNLLQRCQGFCKIRENKYGGCLMKNSEYKSYDELPLFFNALMVAKVLGVSPSSGYELMHEKDFPVLKIGSWMVVHKEKFIQWVDRHTRGGSSE